MKQSTRRRITHRGLRLLSAAAAACLLLGSLSGCGTRTADGPLPDLTACLQRLGGGDSDAYATYLSSHAGAYGAQGQRVTLAAQPQTLCEGDSLPVTFRVETAGLYRLCAAAAGGGTHLSSYTASLTLDGELPFAESGQLYFPKQWVTDGTFDYSRQPQLREAERYTTQAHSDKSYVSREIAWYLSAGEHTAVLKAGNQPFTWTELWFEGVGPAETADASPEQTAAVLPILLQAENPQSRTAPSILEQIDRISAGTMPVCENAATYNTLGGTSWQTLGESVTWGFTVEQEGWYCLNLRVRQDYSAGSVSCRRILVDGEEWLEETVPYATDFYPLTVSDARGQTAWKWLSAGEHTVTLSCSLGELEPAVTLVQACVSELNRLYRRILMITGTDPDNYRDYHLDEKLPDVFEDMAVQKECLEQTADYLSRLSTDGGSDTGVFKKLIRQLGEFLKNPDEIPDQITTLNSNISALGTWLLERTAQPLELDWLEWQPYGGSTAGAEAGWWAQVRHDIRRIARSYTESYDSLGGSVSADRTVSVWAVTGRDQAQILQDLSTQKFTAATGISATVKLVTADAIMPATVAGLGPDVVLFNASGTVLGYAIRDALTELSELPGFEEAAADFYESALTPYRFNGGVWALPETQSFSMLFYRSDILEELGLTVPQTWEEVYDCITTLQKNNMTFGCTGYETFLYQNGGAYYAGDGAYSLLDSEESVTAFRQWTKFYTNFNLPLSFNFINRFRTGEMPLAVADYSSYNSLVVFAPEISGLWGMAQVPGTLRADGTPDRSVNSTGTGAMLLRNTADRDASWSYLKWWVSGEAQSDYARTLETKLGTSARVMVASKAAFEQQMWTAEEKALLRSQWEWAVGTPEVAGGYLMGRHISNAFRRIVYQDADIRETLAEYTKIIDKELTLKRQEYGLDGGETE